MKNGLHRKKLQLAMQAMATENIDKFMELDYNFVASKFPYVIGMQDVIL